MPLLLIIPNNVTVRIQFSGNLSLKQPILELNVSLDARHKNINQLLHYCKKHQYHIYVLTAGTPILHLTFLCH